MLCSLLAWATFAAAEGSPQQKLDRQFQSAVAQYNAGQFAEAAAQLEGLLPHVPNNFEVQELLGMVYASMSQDAKAIAHLEAATNATQSIIARINANLVASAKYRFKQCQSVCLFQSSITIWIERKIWFCQIEF